MPTYDNKKQLFQVLETGSEEEKSTILESLGRVDDTSLVLPLVDVLEKEKSRALRERLLMVLDRLVPLSQFRDVDRMLRSPDPQVRNGVVEIIKRSDIPIIRFLEKLGDDPDKDVRKFVIDALSQEKSPQAMALIRNHLKDDDINIRYTAAEHLGGFGDRDSAPLIEDMLLDSHHLMVTCACLEALAKIGASPRKEEILEKFTGGRADSLMVFPLLKYIGAFGSAEYFPFIERILDNYPEIYTKEIIDAVEGIMKVDEEGNLPPELADKLETLGNSLDNIIDKYAIIKLLTRKGGESPAEKLRKIRAMLDEPDEMIRLAAVELLADIGEEEDIQRLEDLAEHTESDELLEAVGDAVMKIEDRYDPGE